MKGKMSTDLGNISVDTEAIAEVAGTEAMECFGVVGHGHLFRKGRTCEASQEERASHTV